MSEHSNLIIYILRSCHISSLYCITIKICRESCMLSTRIYFMFAVICWIYKPLRLDIVICFSEVTLQTSMDINTYTPAHIYLCLRVCVRVYVCMYIYIYISSHFIIISYKATEFCLLFVIYRCQYMTSYNFRQSPHSLSKPLLCGSAIGWIELRCHLVPKTLL